MSQIDAPSPAAAPADAPDAFGARFLLADLGREYYRVVDWSLTAPAPLEARLAQLSQHVKSFFIELTEDSTQSFSNHFARLTYVAQAARLDPRLSYYLHQFDREAPRAIRGEETRLPATEVLRLGAKALADVIHGVTREPSPEGLRALLPADYGGFALRPYAVAEFKPELRALVLEDLPADETLRVRLVRSPGMDHFVHYGREGYNAQFVGPAVALLRRHFTWPVEVNLINVEVDANGELNPQHLVIDPDYLVDISAVAKCFDVEGPEPVKYLLSRVTPFRTSVAILAGNVANHFLDSALNGRARGKDFRESFRETFAQYPLVYARLSDADVRELMEACAKHYDVIAASVERHLPAERIAREACVVEPSFYAERYGLQGRLDAFVPPRSRGGDAAIVELKSGSIWRPNEHQINQEHYIQTLLYDLLVKAVFSERTKPRNYVLYSRDADRPLRYAPVNRARQFEALRVRNNMMAIERLLCGAGPGRPCPLDWLRPERYPTLAGFAQRDLRAFYAAWGTLTELERDYCRAFVGFIAREQRVAKVGVHAADRISGQAALWREDLEAKIDGYAILHDLRLVTVAQKGSSPVLGFRRPASPIGEATLTSFRRGDIVVLYPGDAADRAVLRHQVYKATITRLDAETVEVRLRAPQPDLTRFERHERFNLEPDLFDSSFNRLYQNLAEFAAARPEARALVLGLRPPTPPATARVPVPAALTPEQGRLFAEIVNAREYYLLWGPPGTGKTSVMLHHLCAHFATKTRERILVLAFTNRAVDEICKAVEQIGGDIRERYLRIGSSFGCDERFAPQLLQSRIAGVRSRRGIRELLARQRIVVGTVSSVTGKGEALFDLLDFDRVLIDEASQLLEPQLVHLMTRFPRTVLIGDHRQLPAVVTQAEALTRIEDPGLLQLGLRDLRNSLFERLFERCSTENWDWAYGQLTRQGRLHTELAAYVNAAFYDGTLRHLGPHGANPDWQVRPNAWDHVPDDCTDKERLYAGHGYVVVDTPVDLSDRAFRTNRFEAAEIVACLRSLIRLRRAHRSDLIKPHQVGIITPYRAQIARIRQALHASDLGAEWGGVNVDTVERYQGSTYDYVLLSLCANQAAGVRRLSSTNAEQIDRKLNVALTRARYRVIAFGNVALLRAHNPAYRQFLDHCEDCGGVYEAAATPPRPA